MKLRALAVTVALAGVLYAGCDTDSPTEPGALASIVINRRVMLALPATQQFMAEGRDAGGGVVAIAPAWSMVGPGGTISSAGVFTADAMPGTFTSTVTARSHGITGSALVKVTNGAVESVNANVNGMDGETP